MPEDVQGIDMGMSASVDEIRSLAHSSYILVDKRQRPDRMSLLCGMEQYTYMDAVSLRDTIGAETLHTSKQLVGIHLM